MGKSIPIPDEVLQTLQALAKAQGKTTSEIIVDVLECAYRDHPLRAYLKDGVFDEKKFRADCRQAAGALERSAAKHADLNPRPVKLRRGDIVRAEDEEGEFTAVVAQTELLARLTVVVCMITEVPGTLLCQSAYRCAPP